MSLRVSQSNRALGLIALMAAASIGVGGVVAVVSGADAASLGAARLQLGTLHALAAEASDSISGEEAALDDYVFSHSAAALRRFDDAAALNATMAARIAPSTGGLPGIQTAVDGLAAASLGWRGQVAEPTVVAVKLSDQAALARFASLAGDDHQAVDAGLARLTRALARADLALVPVQAAADLRVSVGTAFAFGFLFLAFAIALVVVRRFGRALEMDARQATVLNGFTAVTSFAADDGEVAASSLVALRRLVAPDASVVHILNRSMDRAMPEASAGDAIAEILPMRGLDRCAGVLRGSIFVADDLTDELTVHCPVYPAASGTLACVPLDSGETVGAVHLYWRRPNALPIRSQQNLARITEHAALAIGNRRLLAALHGQANTDARTGLANSRSFDLVLEAALTTRIGQEPLSVLMLDLDHFKEFNDRHGHPAGDEALRVFGAVLRSCMRESDVAARYGGEEFAVLLPGMDGSTAAAIAERIRSRTETTIISLAPGMTDHITVSIGVSSAPDQGLDRVTLLRIADEALYRAKAAGRNRVVGPVGAIDPAAPTVRIAPAA